MLLSSNMMRFHDAFGIKETFNIFAKAGIQGMDFNNDVGEYHTKEHDKQFYIDLAKYAKEQGIAICQAHAPFPSSFPEDEKNEPRFWDIVQGMQNAAYLGAPMIVVHPCCHLKYAEDDNAEKLFEYNFNFYKRLIPYAKEFGIKIAIENIGRDSVTSTPERLIKLFDALNDPVFTICFDVGHCLFQGVDPAEAIIKLGDRLVDGCTHVHDNNGERDSHTLPYYGKVEWESVMKALADIGYKGDLNYEASAFLAGLPTDPYPEGLAYQAVVGKYLIGRCEYYKNNA